MTVSKIQSGAGDGLLAATTVADTSSQVDHRSEMIRNQRNDSHGGELSNKNQKGAMKYSKIKGLKHSDTANAASTTTPTRALNHGDKT